MGHTNQTTNLHLPQFVGSDKPTWLSDVNGAMLAIDNAYGQIEADASAAATAASGAVTTATSAASTASSAASTASAAASNASTALTTANNAAGTANAAATTANGAAEIATGKVLAEITADGVKTNAQILGELYAYAAQITAKSVLKVDASVYQLSTLFPDAAVFARVYVGTDITASVFTLTSSPGSKYAHITTGGSVTISDTSSEVPTNGSKFTLYK